MLLRRLGNEVRTAHGGSVALEVAGVFLPEIVLLDIGMPGMSGYEVARKLREDPALAEVLIIAQSGWGQDEDRRLSKEAGFDHHLVKPINTKTLESLFRSLETSPAPLRTRTG
jgi:two-component system CheB/CheR fusion protein